MIVLKYRGILSLDCIVAQVLINKIFQHNIAPRSTACLDLGGCWLSEVNIAIVDGQGLYLSVFISYRKFLGDESSKQVASILNDKDSECVKCF